MIMRLSLYFYDDDDVSAKDTAHTYLQLHIFMFTPFTYNILLIYNVADS